MGRAVEDTSKAEEFCISPPEHGVIPVPWSGDGSAPFPTEFSCGAGHSQPLLMG